MPAIDAQLFRDTLREEFRSAWQTLRQAHPTEHFYSFGLYTTDCAEYLMVTASTEEGLSVVTEKYLDRYGGDPALTYGGNPALTRASLRWSPCDSPLHGPDTELLPRSQALRDSGPGPYEDTLESNAAIALVFNTAIDVLKELDSEKVFGSDIERANLMLGIWMGDQSDEDRIAFARQLNPEATVARFQKELEEAYEAFAQVRWSE